MKTTKSKSKKSAYISVILFVLIGVLLYYNSYNNNNAQTISKARFDALMQNATIEHLKVDDRYLYIQTLQNRYKIYKDAIDISNIASSYPIEVESSDELSSSDIAVAFLLAMFILYMLRLSHKSKLQQIELNRAYETPDMITDIKPTKSSVKFDDVAGIDMVKEELEEIIDFLKNPYRYKQMGIRMPKGVLLVGPPGVGKTLVAKAVAGEANVPFFYQSGASFTQIYVGMGAKRVNELFNQAKRNAPSIIFIDEIDAVGKSRGDLRNDEREATLNELLTQMDGFEQNSGVIVIAATNKIEVLDDALLRAGRFDRRVHLSLPNLEDREKIIRLYLQNKSHHIDIHSLAKSTVGFSAAALDTLINEAALHALKNGNKVITQQNVDAIKDKVLNGKKLIQSYTKEEKEIQSLYQATKATVASWLGIGYDRISLVSTMLEDFDHEISSRTILLNKAKVYLSGALMCKKRYDEYFTNAKDDIKTAKDLIAQILEEYAMVENFLAQNDNSIELFNQTIEETNDLISQLHPAIDKVSKHLLKYESITHTQTKEILDDIF
jgi:ATP-dependent metalloprotease FtsH